MQTGRLRVEDKQLEYAWCGPRPDKAPTLVFLHEGLGCVAMWRDFPERLANQTGYGALVYSRAGYGESDPAELPRSVRFMHDEALTTLPHVLDELNIQEAIVVGHSDGGSIAIIHAGGTRDKRVRGLILEAPHVFVEEFGLQSIKTIAEEYRSGRLTGRLERYHGENVDQTFWGWNDIWLNPDFKAWNIEEYLPRIDIRVLVIQGEDDQYGTMAQVKAIETGCEESVQTVLLPFCGHSPHLEQAELTLEAMTAFIRSTVATR
jgi:pimeloyl-ACP methyl ester carboxylesterase